MFGNRLPRNLWHQTLDTILERGSIDPLSRRTLWEATWQSLRPKIAAALADGSATEVGSSGLQLQIHRVGCTQQQVGAALFDLSHSELAGSQYSLLIWERSLREACLTNYETRLLFGERLQSTAWARLPLLLSKPSPHELLVSATPPMGWALLKYLHGLSLSEQQGKLHKSLLWELDQA